ncbi:MAG: hypothetical protein KH972_08960 [Peptostreptococcaceae bacterium]|nr:hypothetical protein [Peptostreptococcaceae bacterium]
MENVSIKDVILDKKMDGYGFEKDNFVASGEITVTITLNEYRELVSSKATKKLDIDKAEKDKYARESEISSLKKQVDELKVENYELKKKLDLTSDIKNEEE